MAKKKAKTRKKAVKKVAKKVAKKVVKRAARKPVRRAAGKAKPAARRPAARKRPAPAPSAKARKAGVAAVPAEKHIVGGVLLGRVEDYFAHVGVMALQLLAPVSVGDVIRIKGHTTDITQKVESMQIEHQPVQAASVGNAVGIRISDRARKTDLVYRI
jgi:predicted flap endonuclease-1-like 5' DNA nuclease